MPSLLRSFLGFIILVATIGLATCQSARRADVSVADRPIKAASAQPVQARS